MPVVEARWGPASRRSMRLAWIVRLPDGHEDARYTTRAAVRRLVAREAPGSAIRFIEPPCDDCGRADGTHDPEVEH